MSRKCPKQNHYFLTWLNANGYRFNAKPRLLRIRKRRIDFCFQGMASALRFSLSITTSGGPWIAVEAVMPGKDAEGIICFFGAEQQTSEGWITLRQPPENRRLWQTREELWEELCLEAFLAWCNSELTANSWLVVYEGFGMSDAKIHPNEELAKDSLSSCGKNIFGAFHSDSASAIEKLSTEVQYSMVPLFKTGAGDM